MNSVVAIIVGSFLSLTAFIKPDVGIRWIFLAAILVVGTIGYFLPQYNLISWGVGFSGMFLIFIAFIHFISKSRTPLDRVTISLIIFAVFLFIPAISNANNPLQIISYSKNIVQYWGFVPLAALGFFPLKSRNTVVKFIVLIIIIQAIVSIYQAMFVVDWVNRLAGGDSVVGTFGGTPDGGGSSGAQTIFLSVIISVALAIYISNHLKIIFLIPVLLISLVPVSLNETKVFFVLVPIALLYLLVTGFKRFPLRTLQVTLIGLGLVLIIFVIYFLYLQHSRAGEQSKTVTEYTERMSESKSGFYVGEGRDSANSRLGSIKFWWIEQTKKDHILESLFGHGLGASKTGGVYPGKLTDTKSPYYGLMLDRTGLSSLLWDIGIIGTILFYFIFASCWTLALKIRKHSNISDYEKSLIWGLECAIIILALSNIYDKYYFTNPGLNAFTLLVFAFVVGTMVSSSSESLLDLSRNEKH